MCKRIKRRDTRERLQADELSANAYPTDFGGLVFVDVFRHGRPVEADLAPILEAAKQAVVVRLKFDCEAPVITGLPTFGGATGWGLRLNRL